MVYWFIQRRKDGVRLVNEYDKYYKKIQTQNKLSLEKWIMKKKFLGSPSLIQS
jgi:hypothetical protein